LNTTYGPLDVAELLPGDVLLYSPSSVFGWAIAFMTSGGVSHVEVYKGGGVSYASRDGIGVNEYPLRTEQLKEVRRCTKPLNMGAMAITFSHLKGHGYDWSAIKKFALMGRPDSTPGKEISSELATILIRAAGARTMFAEQSPDEISPRDFQKTDWLRQVWAA
jgi:hypothetical protein